MPPARFLSCIAILIAALLAQPAPAQTRAASKTARTMPTGRQFHGAAVLGRFLYVVGGYGTFDDPTTEVLKSPISADGSLGAWTQTTPLPSPRSYVANCTIVLNDIVYVMGGRGVKDDPNENTVYYARPSLDGNLSQWLMSPPYGEGGGVSTPTTLASPGHLHVMGGIKSDGTISRDVWTIPVLPNGVLTQWERGPMLPEPLWFHNAGVVAGRAYVWGGLNVEKNDVASSKVYSAPILRSGNLGNWQMEAPMPAGCYSAAGAVAGNFLLSFCPRLSGGDLTNDIWFNQVDAVGRLSQWQRALTDIDIKIYHAAATDYRLGNVYIPGGRIDKQNETLQGTVYYFSLTTEAQMAAARYAQEAQMQHVAQSTQLGYIAETNLTNTAVPGFKPVIAARAEASGATPKPLVMYFNSQVAQPCQQQVEALKTANVPGMTQAAVFAWVDVNESPQVAQQMGVWVVPAWRFYNARGEAKGGFDGVLNAQDLATRVQQLMQ